MPVEFRGVDAAGRRIADIAGDLSTNFRQAADAMVNESAFKAKRAMLDALGSRVPSMGFSRHDQPGGRGFFVQYNLHTFTADPFFNLWAVPPGPYIVEGGAQAHDITTTWGRGNTPRTIRHPGVPAQPFWAATAAAEQLQAVRDASARFTDAVGQSL